MQINTKTILLCSGISLFACTNMIKADITPTQNIKKELSNSIVQEEIEIKKDDKAPVFTYFSDEITIIQYDDKNDLYDYFKAEDENEVKIQIKGNYDLNRIGNYPISVIAYDTNNNQTVRNSMIKVISNEQGQELNININDSPLILSSRLARENNQKNRSINEHGYSSYVEYMLSEDYIPPKCEEIPKEYLGNSQMVFSTINEAENWINEVINDPNSIWYNQTSYSILYVSAVNGFSCEKDPCTINFHMN